MNRILLVDDSPPFVAEARSYLEASNAGRVESVASAEAALERLERGGIDVVLMDIGLPGVDGLEATRRLKGEANAFKIVIVSLHDGAEYERAAYDAGADGFVAKSTLGETLLPVLERVLANEPGRDSSG